MFDTEFFQKWPFSNDQVNQYFGNAFRDFKIAESAQETEVKFTFSYQAFLKLGIALIAKEGYKVKMRQGHHIQIISQFAKLAQNKEIQIYGEAMRRKRNIDLYSGGTLVTAKEAQAYLNFLKILFNKFSSVFQV